VCSARAASRARPSGAPGRPALAPSSAWHPSGQRVSPAAVHRAARCSGRGGQLTKVFFCSESTSSFEKRTGRSLRANLSASVRHLLVEAARGTAAIGAAEGDVRGEDMLLDLRGGFRVLCAHVAAVRGAGCQRDDAAAGRSRSSALALAERCGRYDACGQDRRGTLDVDDADAPES
jgi:hypothetical protein